MPVLLHLSSRTLSYQSFGKKYDMEHPQLSFWALRLAEALAKQVTQNPQSNEDADPTMLLHMTGVYEIMLLFVHSLFLIPVCPIFLISKFKSYFLFYFFIFAIHLFQLKMFYKIVSSKILL